MPTNPRLHVDGPELTPPEIHPETFTPASTPSTQPDITLRLVDNAGRGAAIM